MTHIIGFTSDFVKRRSEAHGKKYGISDNGKYEYRLRKIYKTFIFNYLRDFVSLYTYDAADWLLATLCGGHGPWVV